MSSRMRIHGSRNQREEVKVLPLTTISSESFHPVPESQRNFVSCSRDFELSGFRCLRA